MIKYLAISTMGQYVIFIRKSKRLKEIYKNILIHI